MKILHIVRLKSTCFLIFNFWSFFLNIAKDFYRHFISCRIWCLLGYMTASDRRFSWCVCKNNAIVNLKLDRNILQHFFYSIFFLHSIISLISFSFFIFFSDIEKPASSEDGNWKLEKKQTDTTITMNKVMQMSVTLDSGKQLKLFNLTEFVMCNISWE